MKCVDFKSMTIDELKNYLVHELNEKGFRAKQIFQWLHQKNVTSFHEMNNLTKELRDKLTKRAYITQLKPIERHVAQDGTIKYLFRLKDDETIESVHLPYSGGRQSVCISSQVGCSMGCTFCATGLSGFVRNLTSGEIIDQVYAVQRDLDLKITNVVLMGMGEPLLNYKNTLKAVRLLNHPEGAKIGIRRITLSTCGIIPKIRELMKENLQLVLAISLHAPNNQLRNQLMPINRKYPLEELIQACKEYSEFTKRRITFEYALISGVNDLEEHAYELISLLKGLLVHINLIPINPVQGTELERTGQSQTKLFQALLNNGGIETTLREERGADIEAACGQLRSRNRR